MSSQIPPGIHESAKGVARNDVAHFEGPRSDKAASPLPRSARSSRAAAGTRARASAGSAACWRAVQCGRLLERPPPYERIACLSVAAPADGVALLSSGATARRPCNLVQEAPGADAGPASIHLADARRDASQQSVFDGETLGPPSGGQSSRRHRSRMHHATVRTLHGRTSRLQTRGQRQRPRPPQWDADHVGGTPRQPAFARRPRRRHAWKQFSLCARRKPCVRPPSRRARART